MEQLNLLEKRENVCPYNTKDEYMLDKTFLKVTEEQMINPWSSGHKDLKKGLLVFIYNIDLSGCSKEEIPKLFRGAYLDAMIRQLDFDCLLRSKIPITNLINH